MTSQERPLFERLVFHLNRKAANRLWLLYVLSTITNGGNHPYFDRDYRPIKLRPSNTVDVDNHDGFFSNLPKSLKPKKCAGRALSFVETAANKVQRVNQQLVVRHEQQLRDAQAKLNQFN
jgi:hypothetical protein